MAIASWGLRMIVALWAVFFLWTGFTGVITSSTYEEMFAIQGDVFVMNTIRADLSAFFIVSAICAGWAALNLTHSKLLLVPIALFAVAMAGRILGVLMGDPFEAVIRSSIIAEALSVLLLTAAYFIFTKQSQR